MMREIIPCSMMATHAGQARSEKNVLHVAAAHMSVVDEVGRFAVPLQYALYRDLGVLGP